MPLPALPIGRDFSWQSAADKYHMPSRICFNSQNRQANGEQLQSRKRECDFLRLSTGRRVKEAIVKEREFENRRLNAEAVAEFSYRPSACKYTYRMVVVRKNISVAKGEKMLFDEVRYFFYITNVLLLKPEQIVLLANNRCHQENLLAQLHGGVRALTAPVDTLVSNWAYMVMTALAWNLKAWWALLLPEARAPAPTTPRREAVGVGTGVQDIRAGVRAAAVPDCADRSAFGVSAAVMERPSVHLLAFGNRTAVLMTFSGCPDPPRHRTQSCRMRGVA